MLDVIKKAKRATSMYINPESCKPVSARLVVTVNCNFTCQTCTFSWPYWTPERKKDPSLELVKYWISELAEFGIKEIEIGGGEVTLRRDLGEMIAEVQRKGMTCGITTNGWLIGGGQVPFPKVDSMEVSIDGAKPETHEKIRKMPGSFERAIKTIEMAKERGIKVHLNFVVQSDNYLEMADYCNLAKKLGVLASFIPVSLDLDAQPHMPERLNQFDVRLLKEQIQKIKESGVAMNSAAALENFISRTERGSAPQKCLAPYRCILVFNHGQVYPCGAFDKPVGDLVLGKKFKDIWREYRGLRQQVASGKYSFCDKCTYGDLSNRQTLLTSVLPYLKRRFLKQA
ncbi:MAG: radical SAM protein [Candidatus Nealsonbacteria bacterium]|nr:radical SAM protein [Candidatus Nealsonbacteria bacterium]